MIREHFLNILPSSGDRRLIILGVFILGSVQTGTTSSLLEHDEYSNFTLVKSEKPLESLEMICEAQPVVVS